MAGEICALINNLDKLLRQQAAFTEDAQSLLHEAKENVYSIKRSDVRHVPEVRYACKAINNLAQCAFEFLDKVDDLFFYGTDCMDKESQLTRFDEAKDAIRLPEGFFKPLEDLLDQLKRSLGDAETLYKVFSEAHKEAEQSCVRAAYQCDARATQERRKKQRTQIVGGAMAGTAAAGATAGVIALSVIAGVFTAGIGTPVVLGLGAAGGAIAAGVGGGGTAVSAVATYVIAENYEKSEKEFRALKRKFDSLASAANNINVEVTHVRGKILSLEGLMNDVEHGRAAHSSPNAICHSIELLAVRFREWSSVSSSCRMAVISKKEELTQELGGL